VKHSWTFGQQVVPALIAGRSIDEVLIDYDGPQLAVLKKGEDLFLSICIDEDDDNTTRWIQSPISRLEYAALMRGALPVRNALLKPEMILVDISNESETRVWELDPTQVPSKVLPKSGAILPEYVRASFQQRLKSEIAAPFRLGGKGALAKRIPFGGLGRITETLQELWNAIGETLGAQAATLNAAALADGSLEIQVAVDNADIFARIADTYRELIDASYDESNLKEYLGEKPRIKKKYSNYLKAIDDNKIDVLAEWHEGVAFIGSAAAGRTWQSLEPAVDEPKITALHLVGHLEGYAGKRRFFQFLELGTGRRLSGRLDAPILDIPVHEELRLGPTTKYRVEIEESRIGDQEPKYTLKSFAPIPD
jgi:hypothetical protein